MLRDSGIQYSFISYVDVIQNGMPAEYKRADPAGLRCACPTSRPNASASSADAGGTVIADFMPGLWDQHGKGRPAGGVLDEMFGVQAQTRRCKPADLFGGKLWCEAEPGRQLRLENL